MNETDHQIRLQQIEDTWRGLRYNDVDYLMLRVKELVQFCSHVGILKAQEEHNELRRKYEAVERQLTVANQEIERLKGGQGVKLYD